MRFTNRVAIVTGAGAGVGRASALLLAAEGAHVVVADFDQDRANAVAREIFAAGGSVETAFGDANYAPFVERLIGGTAARHGRLDIVHANVGATAYGSVTETSDDEWDDGIRSNLRGAFLAIRGAMRAMMEQEHGAIVATASLAALGTVGGVAPWYGAAKAGLLALVRQAAVEAGPHGVRVNAVVLGATQTETLEARLGANAVSAYTAQIPLRYMATPDDAARGVAFLASEDAASITGIGLPIDGGFSAVMAQPVFG